MYLDKWDNKMSCDKDDELQLAPRGLCSPKK